MIQVNAISLDHTRYYRIRQEDLTYIREIRSVYIYNPASCTNLCELTPSYELQYLHTYIVWNRDVVNETQLPECTEEMEQRYCHEDTEDNYMHCWRVKGRTDQKECGKFEDMEAAREHLQGNWPF